MSSIEQSRLHEAFLPVNQCVRERSWGCPGEDGTDRPIAYFSRKLLPREQHYSTIEKECLAIKLSVQAFHTYLIGRTFTIQTDHKALAWLDSLKDTNPHLTRWSLSLQSYSYTVEYRKGTANGNADALSCIINEASNSV